MFLVGVACLVAVPLTFVDAARDQRASAGDGIVGTLVVERVHCGYRSGCHSEGTWTSEDGRVVLEDMSIERGEPEVGETVAGRVLSDAEDSGVVYPLDYEQGIPAWAWSFVFLPMGVSFLVMGGFDIRDWRARAR